MPALCTAYALLKPAAVAARFISPGTMFQGSPARTVKKLRRISSRPRFGRTFSGSAFCRVLAAAAGGGSNQSALACPVLPLQSLYMCSMVSALNEVSF
jgi:hypothetical protein